MKLHITNLYGHYKDSVALMAQTMVTNIALNMGFRELGIYSYRVEHDSQSELSSRIDGILSGVSFGDLVVMQLPTWNILEFEEAFINRVRSYHHLKLVIFIHDVIPLMFESNEYLIDRTINLYNQADAIIVPSQKMADELRQRGLTVQKIIIQYMWDYPTQLSLDTPTYNQTINFIGNPERFTFIKNWTYANPLRVFSKSTIDTQSLNVMLESWQPNDELLINLAKRGGFGLVWSQKEELNYYELNVPYKLASYIAAGLPVIVQDTLSNQQIVKENNIGLVAKTLEEANDMVSQLTTAQYNDMVENVKTYRQLITNGYYTKKILIDAIHAVLTH